MKSISPFQWLPFHASLGTDADSSVIFRVRRDLAYALITIQSFRGFARAGISRHDGMFIAKYSSQILFEDTKRDLALLRRKEQSQEDILILLHRLIVLVTVISETNFTVPSHSIAKFQDGAKHLKEYVDYLTSKLAKTGVKAAYIPFWKQRIRTLIAVPGPPVGIFGVPDPTL